MLLSSVSRRGVIAVLGCMLIAMGVLVHPSGVAMYPSAAKAVEEGDELAMIVEDFLLDVRIEQVSKNDSSVYLHGRVLRRHGSHGHARHHSTSGCSSSRNNCG